MLQDNWFMNLSSIDISFEVQYLLQYLLLGEKFGLPINQDNKEKLNSLNI